MLYKIDRFLFFKTKVQLKKSHIRLINNYYSKNNKKLASLLDINLKEYNY
jgi:hypothetical protein